MSYILDALKKAEVERQVGQVPSAQQLLQPEAGETSTPTRYRLLIIVGVILNLLLVGYLYLGRQPASSPAASGEAEFAASTAGQSPLPADAALNDSREKAITGPAPKPPTQTVSQKQEQKQVQRQVRIADESRSAPSDTEVEAAPRSHLETVSTPFALQPYRAPAVEETSDSEPPADQPLANEKPADGPRANAPNAAVTGDQSIPRRRELPRTMQIAIPELELAALVYSDNPAGRMVFVNSRLMREGQAVDESLQLLEIRRHEVVFSFNGVPFRVEMF